MIEAKTGDLVIVCGPGDTGVLLYKLASFKLSDENPVYEVAPKTAAIVTGINDDEMMVEVLISNGDGSNLRGWIGYYNFYPQE